MEYWCSEMDTDAVSLGLLKSPEAFKRYEFKGLDFEERDR